MVWSIDSVARLDGKTALVTGANSGLGFETTKMLASKGAKVIMACRNTNTAALAAEQIVKAVSEAELEVRQLDLADLDSIRDFADGISASYDALDFLINNAGVMALPERRTAQGFEMQFGTNHLGHFALTARLSGLVEAAGAGRIVTVASQAHRIGRIDLDDPNFERRTYQRWTAYGQAKLSNLIFAIELGRRLQAAGAKTISAGAHPGYASTNLQTAGAKMEGSSLKERFMLTGNAIFAHSARDGALPTLMAATADDVSNGDYFGPDGVFEMQGRPKKVRGKTMAYDEALADGLWDLSENLTGVQFSL